MLQLLSTIDHEFPTSKQDLSKEIQEYHQYRDDLYSIDGVILYKDCIVIPPSIQEDILDILHSAHQSISPMLSRTMETVFWPGFTKAIHVCQNCLLTAIVIHLPNHITIIASSGPRLPFSMYLWQFLPLSRCPNSCCH